METFTPKLYRLQTRKQSSFLKPTTTRTLIKNRNLAQSVFVGINRNHHVTIKSHEQASLSIDTASSSAYSNLENNRNGGIIPSDVLYAEGLKSDSAYNDVALFFRCAFKIKMSIGTEPTVM